MHIIRLEDISGKNGIHKSIYWVKVRQSPREKYQGKTEPSREKNGSLIPSIIHYYMYVGEWSADKKEGYGVQQYPNGDKYEGSWQTNKRSGKGTYWRLFSHKLRREYTGDWNNDHIHGKGTFFYQNNDRYDGFWEMDKKKGDGRMIFQNGDIYEGQWSNDKRNGYGVLTKRNGDYYEGQWVNDMKEGQGSYYYSNKGKLFVGEWSEDHPKCGVYTEVEDPEIQSAKMKYNRNTEKSTSKISTSCHHYLS